MRYVPTIVELIGNATAAGRAMMLAADAAAQKALLSLTKSDVGLSNVENTSDANKPVSTAQAAAIASKIGGSTGATANRVLTANGTGGSTLQASPVTIDGSGNVTGVAALTASGTITAPVHAFPNTTTPTFPASGVIAFCPGSADVWFRSPFGSCYIQIGGGSASNISSAGSMTIAGTGGVRLQSNPLSSGPSVFAKVPSTSAINFRNFADSADIDLTARDITASGNLICSTAGTGLQLKSGTGARAGTASLVAGTVTVTNTTVTANTRILLSVHTPGGTVGALSSTRSAGASFTINSSSITDTSVISYLLIEVN